MTRSAAFAAMVMIAMYVVIGVLAARAGVWDAAFMCWGVAVIIVVVLWTLGRWTRRRG